MPVSRGKRQEQIQAEAELHARVAKLPGFQLRDMKVGESPAKVARLLRNLEGRGMVLFVAGVGWVDSSPAIRRHLGKAGDSDAVDRLNRFLGLAK